jgi:hypothetical protein
VAQGLRWDRVIYKAPEIAQRRLVFDGAIASEAFYREMPIVQELNFPSLTRSDDLDHDGLWPHLRDSIGDATRVKFVQKGVQPVFGS